MSRAHAAKIILNIENHYRCVTYGSPSLYVRTITFNMTHFDYRAAQSYVALNACPTTLIW